MQPPAVRQPPPTPAPAQAPAVLQPDVPASAETPPATLGCDPAPVQSMLGEVFSPALQARARSAAGAETARSLPPSQAATSDYRAGRLNLQLGADGRLQRAFCG